MNQIATKSTSGLKISLKRGEYLFIVWACGSFGGQSFIFYKENEYLSGQIKENLVEYKESSLKKVVFK